MKTQEKLIKFLKEKLVDAEQERDKWHNESLTDNRCFVKGEVEYQRGKINMIRQTLLFLKEDETEN